MKTSVGIGLLGLGVVGGGVARTLVERAEHVRQLAGCDLSLEGVLVRDPSRPRSFDLPPSLVTTRIEDILDNPAVDVVVEVMGGQFHEFRNRRQVPVGTADIDVAKPG